VWKAAFMELGGVRAERNEEFDSWVRRRMSEIQGERKKNERGDLNDPISTVEIEEAWKKLKKAKATGYDAIANEELKVGGDSMVEALFVLCNSIFEREQCPRDWRKGLISLIHKQGDARLPSNYRGITLLSCVYKLFTTILTTRVTNLMEGDAATKPLLDDAQGGFRKGRSCIDSVFALTELTRVRRKAGLPTYVAMLDIQKAYDRVYRDALWVQLWEIGIKGKLWRVITDIYKEIECAVLVNGEQSEWFANLVGLRQGCVMSPILFAIFIDSLAKRIRVQNLGVQVDENRIGAFLIADDLALIASSASELQEMLDLIGNCSKELRFNFNNDKSGIMIFGTQSGGKWSLAGKDIPVVDSYKYLGVIVDGLLAWKLHKERTLAKAKQSSNQVFGILRRTDCMSARAAVQVYKALVLPVLEYGAEVWGNCEWEDAELLQRSVARRILGAKQSTSIAFLMGELGWWPLSARRDLLRLRFWWKLVNMQNSRGVKLVYLYCRRKFKESFVSGKDLSKLKKHSMKWCEYTFSLLLELGLDQRWWTEQLGTEKEWNATIFRKIHEREEKRWKTTMDGNVKLELYRQVKTTLSFEQYLVDERSREGRVEFSRFRSGSNNLRIDKGREDGLVREKRLCLLCMLSVEDVQHVMLDCPAYAYERRLLWDAIERAIGTRMEGLSRNRKMTLMFDTRAQQFNVLYQPVRSFLMGVRKMRARTSV